MEDVLALDAVGVRFGPEPEVLCDLSLRLAAGEVLAVEGARGSGKSLLAMVAAGLRRPDRGRVRLIGVEPAALGRGGRAELRRRIGFCPERPLQDAGLTDIERVALPLRLAGTPARLALAEAAALLDRLGGVGAPRRVGLAMAVVAHPALAILDEPFATDPRTAEALPALLDRLRQDGVAILLTGGPGVAAHIPGARRVTLANGRTSAA